MPVDLYLRAGAAPFRCILGDFSELTVRLRPEGQREPMPAMAPNDEVTIVIDLGSAARTYLIRAAVFRRDPQSCVLRLEQRYQDGEFAPLKLMDTLEIKAGLLNYRC